MLGSPVFLIHLFATLIFVPIFDHHIQTPKILALGLLVCVLAKRHGFGRVRWWLPLILLMGCWNITHPWDFLKSGALPLLGLCAWVATPDETSKDRDALRQSFTVGGVCVTLYLLLQWVGLDPIPWEVGTHGSFFGNGNFAAHYLLVALFLGKFPADVRGVALRGTIVLGILLCRSRGVYGVLGLWLLFGSGQLPIRWRYLLSTFLILGTVGSAWLWRSELRPMMGHLSDLRAYSEKAMEQPANVDLRDPWFRGKRSSIITRAILWGNSIAALGDYGLLGAGMGQFRCTYSKYGQVVAADPNLSEAYRPHSPHNLPLELAVQWGAPLALILLGLLLKALFALPRSPYRDVLMLQVLLAMFSINYLNPVVVVSLILMRPLRQSAEGQARFPLLLYSLCMVWLAVVGAMDLKWVQSHSGMHQRLLFPELEASTAYEADDYVAAWDAWVAALAQDPGGPQTIYHAALTAMMRYEVTRDAQWLQAAVDLLTTCQSTFPFYGNAQKQLERLEQRYGPLPAAHVLFPVRHVSFSQSSNTSRQPAL